MHLIIPHSCLAFSGFPVQTLLQLVCPSMYRSPPPPPPLPSHTHRHTQTLSPSMLCCACGDVPTDNRKLRVIAVSPRTLGFESLERIMACVLKINRASNMPLHTRDVYSALIERVFFCFCFLLRAVPLERQEDATMSW